MTRHVTLFVVYQTNKDESTKIMFKLMPHLPDTARLGENRFKVVENPMTAYLIKLVLLTLGPITKFVRVVLTVESSIDPSLLILT